MRWFVGVASQHKRNMMCKLYFDDNQGSFTENRDARLTLSQHHLHTTAKCRLSHQTRALASRSDPTTTITFISISAVAYVNAAQPSVLCRLVPPCHMECPTFLGCIVLPRRRRITFSLQTPSQQPWFPTHLYVNMGTCSSPQPSAAPE